MSSSISIMLGEFAVSPTTSLLDALYAVGIIERRCFRAVDLLSWMGV
jgi:hypothetical protein